MHLEKHLASTNETEEGVEPVGGQVSKREVEMGHGQESMAEDKDEKNRQ